MIELDRHIEILLLSNDCVIVPDFGGFMAHHVDARKDGADGMLLPPARTIGFNPKLTINDSLLAQSYVECYDVSYPEALVRISDEVRELKQHLENDGSYELHGIGVISLNGEGRYEFEPCEAGVLTPSLYGLSGFEMQLLRELDDRLEKDGENKSYSAKHLDVDQTLTEKVSGDNESDVEKARGQNIVAFWRTVAAACVAALAFLLYPSSLGNNSQVLTAGAVNVELLQQVLPKMEEDTANTAPSEARNVDKVAGKADTQDIGATESQSSREGYVIVLASRVNLTNAEAYVENLKKRGYTEAKVADNDHNTKVVYGFYAKQEEAFRALRDLRDKAEFAEAWVMKHHQ